MLIPFDSSCTQDTQLLLWDLALDEIAVPLRHPSGGSPTFSSGSPSAHWDNACPPTGVLQPSPRMRDVPKLSPLVAHRVHVDPLSGLEFTSESILTICREGLIKIWARPSHSENNQQPDSSDQVIGNATAKDKMLTSLNKAGASGSSFKQSSVVFTWQALPAFLWCSPGCGYSSFVTNVRIHGAGVVDWERLPAKSRSFFFPASSTSSLRYTSAIIAICAGERK